MLILALLVLTGCLHSNQRNQPFTRDWVHQKAKQAELEARDSYEGDLVLVNKGGPLQTTLVTDKKGRARLRVGRDSGWSANLKVRDGGPDVKLKYKIEW